MQTYEFNYLQIIFHFQKSLPSVIRINVGGVHYETLLATLCAEDSMLSSMFSGKHKLERDKDGCPFIDRPGVPFGFILNFLRDRSMMPPRNFTMQVWEILAHHFMSIFPIKFNGQNRWNQVQEESGLSIYIGDINCIEHFYYFEILDLIYIYNIAFANSERWLAKSRVDIIQCQHGNVGKLFV